MVDLKKNEGSGEILNVEKKEKKVHPEQMAKNDFVAEVKKFTNKHVVVEIHNGETFEGKLKGLHFANGHCVLMTDTEKIFIRGVKLIKRKRNAEE